MASENDSLSEYHYLFEFFLVGDSGVGKSCLLSRFLKGTYIKDEHGVECGVKIVELENKRIKLRIWDIAGRKRVRNIAGSYCWWYDGIVFVYDVTNKKSFDNIKELLRDIDRSDSKNIYKLLIGAKCDLTSEKAVDCATAKEFANELGIPFLETSAKDNINVEQAFMTMTADLMKRVCPVAIQETALLSSASSINTAENHNSVTDDINGLLKEKKGTDVTFVLETSDGTKKVSAHQLVLAVRSPHFADEFYGKQRNGVHQCIHLKGFCPKAFQEMIRYCYDHKPRMKSINEACSLIKVAAEFKVTTLFNFCLSFFKHVRIEPDSVFSVLEISEKLEDASLRDMCLKILEEQTCDVLASYELIDITPAMVRIILDLLKLSLSSEYELIKWVFRWATVQSEDKDSISGGTREYLEKFLQDMDFLSLTSKEFAMLCRDNPHFFISDEMASIFMNIALPGTEEMPHWYNKDRILRTYLNSEE